MINYDEINKFFIGTVMPVLINAGGMFVELGEGTTTLLYKLDSTHFAIVNRKGAVAQLIDDRKELIESFYVVPVNSLYQVTEKGDIVRNSTVFKRLTFKPENYDANFRL